MSGSLLENLDSSCQRPKPFALCFQGSQWNCGRGEAKSAPEQVDGHCHVFPLNLPHTAETMTLRLAANAGYEFLEGPEPEFAVTA